MTHNIHYPTMQAAADGRFRILQVTDLHTDAGEEANERTWADIRAMLERFHPDLLAVTGDVWLGDEEPDIAPVRMRRDIHALGRLGVPWAFVWGNHDWGMDQPDVWREIAAAPNAIMPREAVSGNYRIAIEANRQPLWDIYLLNSHNEGLVPEDVEWLEQEAQHLAAERHRKVPAALYFHVPLKQYEEARQAGHFAGIGEEDVLYYSDDGTRIEPIKRAGDIRLCFVGHSHRNDYHFLEGDIVFAYGRVTGHGGYGDNLRRGGKLLTLGPGDAFDFVTVFPDGTTWRAE